MPSHDFKLGDIVALQSHPFYEYFTETIIAGDTQLLSPLMVIAEILKDNKDQYDEKTGDEISRIGLLQCKCIWYSNKSNQFEEAWISSKMLKLIKGNNKDLQYQELIQKEPNYNDRQVPIKIYSSVIFKTNTLEYNKRKSTLSQDENFKDEKNTITACLSFVSPVMEIIQIIPSKELDQKEGRYNIKTGEKRKFTSDLMVKCKWFNPASDKFSEKILPICVVDKIDFISEEVVDQIKKAIFKSSCFLLNGTILQPKKIIYKAGSLFVKAFDFVYNKNIDVPLSTTLLIEVSSYRIDKHPKFDYIDTGVYDNSDVLDELLDVINKSSIVKNYIRIKYKNRVGELSVRTLKDFEIKQVLYNKKIVFYLKGFCMSANEIRTFSLNEIYKLEVLNLKY